MSKRRKFADQWKHRMNIRSLSITAFLLTFFLSQSAFAGDKEDISKAINEGKYEEALRELKPVAEQGHAWAQDLLGLMYAQGQGVPQDDAQANKWYRAAANQGYAEAQNRFGWMYLSGRGVPKDEEEAVKWIQAAADQGNAHAQSSLGFMYAQGLGVSQNYNESIKWYRAAAEQGDAVAQFHLGLLYEIGRNGAQKDYAEALKWYSAAAAQGKQDARLRIGFMYEAGRGVPKDYVIAYALYNLYSAKDLSHGGDTAYDREKIAKKMSPQQIGAGQKLSREMNRPGNFLKALNQYTK
ncbi:tetratricopeptide repeat protein [Castellaniella sp. FW104-16D08]|uniref:tetratricopeptide repeat protein n=1 Tax=unclassified Castellaniella TaxID=2617606 RepID=UPI0033148A09